MLLAPSACFHIFSQVQVAEWPPLVKIAAHLAYDIFSWYKYLIVNLVFSHLGFWSGNLFLIAPFPSIVAYIYLYLIIKFRQSMKIIEKSFVVMPNLTLMHYQNLQK